MGIYDRILVPTDGSAGSQWVIDHAGELARVHDAEVLGLYVVDSSTYTGVPMMASWEGVREVLDGKGETALRQVERRLDDAVDVETTTAEGRPNREIVRVAREHDADCIVMGTHGRGGIDRLILGSVAERVVRTAPVPVVTVALTGPDAVEDPNDGAAETDREPAAPGSG